ncbi:MAG: DUF892 family protein [Chthoniobacterales bacterium]
MKTTSLKLESLRGLLLEELRDLYNAEKQLVDALPKMSEAATSKDLKSAFDHHLRQTREHVSRLKSIFSHLGEKPTGETCEAMKGLIKEGESFVKAKGNMDVRDAGLIGAAQRARLVNVNLPASPRGIQWTRQSVRRYDAKMVGIKDPMGRDRYWFTVTPIGQAEPGTDRWAFEHGWVSITPLSLDLTDHETLHKLAQTLLPTL